MEDLTKKLIREAFEKAEKKSASKTKKGLCDHIKLSLEKEDIKNSISYKSLGRCYDKYIDNKDTSWSPGISTLKYLSKYLGYEDYEDFADHHINIDNTQNNDATDNTASDKNKPQDEEKASFSITNNYGSMENTVVNELKEKPKWLHHIALSVITICILILVFLVWGIDKNVFKISEQCMVWAGDRFIPANCDEENIKLVSFDEALVRNFRKVEPKNYLRQSPEVIQAKDIWRGISPEGNWEYFNSNGVHPVTKMPLEKVSYVNLLSEIEKPEDTTIVKEEKEPVKSDFENTSSKVPVESVTNYTSVSNPKKEEKDENLNRLGIFIFNDNEIDLDVRRIIENTKLDTYNTVGSFLNLSELNSNAKHQLASGDFSILEASLLKKLDYICTGKVHYSFIENMNSTITCKMALTYDVYDRRNGFKIKQHSNNINLSSIGFDRTTAKANVIKKIGDTD
jgi:hypothetical protein